MTLDALVTERRIIICAGSGGVGKTTNAAVLAMEAARRGRRSVVVTIDPAKRLADALGLSGIGNEPRRIDGDWPGEMSAVMLDTKGTFDALVETYSESPEQAARILDNRFYRNISGALSGTQEYMAMEKLYALHNDDDFDVVVVDTPPTRHALDFLDAPRRLTHFLDHRLYRVLMMPTRGVMKAVNMAAQTFVRSVSRVVGAEVLDDALAFFGAFSGMEEGFKERANVVLELLEDPATAFVLVAAPRLDTVAEAHFFADRLGDADLAVAALIVNRIHPLFTLDEPDKVARRAEELADTPLGPLARNLADFTAIAANERSHIAGLAAMADEVVMVPYLNSDVHDVDGLNRIGEYLFAGD
ncbi:MAG TPA: ArsA-related P-loop ATPase [Acidimicrobiales bacterium]|nr:ArsA-related P-loop ATPase [Acidimicrobiales bacterium]